jgi:hypothetical protein
MSKEFESIKELVTVIGVDVEQPLIYPYFLFEEESYWHEDDIEIVNAYFEAYINVIVERYRSGFVVVK